MPNFRALTEEQVLDLAWQYFIEDLSLREAGARFFISRSVAAVYLRDLGVLRDPSIGKVRAGQARGRSAEHLRADLELFYYTYKMSQADIGRYYGVGQPAVSAWMKKLNLKPRNKSEQNRNRHARRKRKRQQEDARAKSR